VASVKDVRHKKGALIEFLIAEKGSTRNIHKCLCIVYGSAEVERTTVGRWAIRVTASETGKPGLLDLPRSGRPFTAVSPEMLQRADAVVREDRRIPTGCGQYFSQQTKC
jgi:hypothetical protein